ncbi:MAG: DUF3185 family protein [Cyanobacteria bacterium P01_A01_bin.80]
MKTVKKPLGGVLLVIGIISAFWGINKMNSPVSQVASIFGQNDTAGITATVLGSGAAIAGTALLFIGQEK